MEDREELENVFERVNELINYLQNSSNDTLVDYIVSQVSDCGYCDYDNFMEILEER